MKRSILLFSLFISLFALSSCGSGKWINDGNDGDQPWLNYRTLDEYVEAICPHFFEGVAARGVSTITGNTAPLLMVDGFEVQNFDSIDLHDVVSVRHDLHGSLAAAAGPGLSGEPEQRRKDARLRVRAEEQGKNERNGCVFHGRFPCVLFVRCFSNTFHKDWFRPFSTATSAPGSSAR